MSVPAATLNINAAKIQVAPRRLACASTMQPCWFISRQFMPPAKANTAGRESGENFKPMEYGFGKNEYGGS